MKNKTNINKLANPFGISLCMIMGLVLFLGALNELRQKDYILGVMSFIGAVGFTGTSIYLISVFRKNFKGNLRD